MHTHTGYTRILGTHVYWAFPLAPRTMFLPRVVVLSVARLAEILYLETVMPNKQCVCRAGSTVTTWLAELPAAGSGPDCTLSTKGVATTSFFPGWKNRFYYGPRKGPKTARFADRGGAGPLKKTFEFRAVFHQTGILPAFKAAIFWGFSKRGCNAPADGQMTPFPPFASGA